MLETKLWQRERKWKAVSERWGGGRWRMKKHQSDRATGGRSTTCSKVMLKPSIWARCCRQLHVWKTWPPDAPGTTPVARTQEDGRDLQLLLHTPEGLCWLFCFIYSMFLFAWCLFWVILPAGMWQHGAGIRDRWADSETSRTKFVFFNSVMNVYCTVKSNIVFN